MLLSDVTPGLRKSGEWSDVNIFRGMCEHYPHIEIDSGVGINHHFSLVPKFVTELLY